MDVDNLLNPHRIKLIRLSYFKLHSFKGECMGNNDKFIEKSNILKALAHPTRLCIVKGLIEKENNVTTIQECLELPQSTTSQYLFKLKAAGIIMGERNGLEINYRVINEDAKKVVDVLFPEDN